MMDNPIIEWIKRAIISYALKGLKRVVQQNAERIATGAIVWGFEVSKGVLAGETQRLIESNIPRAVVTGLFLEFIFGVGPRLREFGPGTAMAEHMKDAFGVEKARKYFYKTRADAYARNANSPGTLARMPLTNYGAGFGITGLIRAGDDIVEQFIGTYDVEMFPNDRATNMKVVLTNTTSAHSFLYHLPFVENYERGRGLLPTPMGNITQRIFWNEAIDASRFSSN
jgi:hypothetical protein